MFRPGKVLKVKVELSQEMVGFGRATILEADGNRLYLQLKTSKGQRRVLPKGTKVWFVSDTATNPFNGLWSTTIVSSKIIGGKTAMECNRPKFEALVQKRKQRRVALNCPVRLEGDLWKEVQQANTRNISRSGLGIEIHDDCAEQFQTNHHVDIVVETPVGEIAITSRIVQSRYNWIANRTDIGLEFVRMELEAVSMLDRLLMQLGGKPRTAPEGKERGKENKAGGPGPLSGWLKSSKDNISFVKMKEHETISTLSEADLEELETMDDEDESEDDEFDESSDETSS